MALSIEAIKFNHDSLPATNYALNIRVDATRFVDVPEWRNGISVKASDSPAAYALDTVGGNTISIQAKFRAQPPRTGPSRIRGVTSGLESNPLGDVAPASVTFDDDGNSEWVKFDVTGNLGGAVSVTDIIWEWQELDPQSNAWVAFARTQHRIYVVLLVPTAPWQQEPYSAGNTQLPWTAVLDYACVWAANAATIVSAARWITEKVYALGPDTLIYDCPGSGSKHYSRGVFNCTKFLERLGGGPGNGIYVNCADCATVTSTFSNILGCNLEQAIMGYDFELNPTLAIGTEDWQTACGWKTFTYHEVAWQPPCQEANAVFDACLKVSMIPNSQEPPFVGIQPIQMMFSMYQPRLSPQAENCIPRPPGSRRIVV
ncbi:MAG TPA: hypothetical protein VG323_07070 [Thermoanaerobaculia bacterium]|nr:hypothetical protein [Thermoanaerobaculia bacterium]